MDSGAPRFHCFVCVSPPLPPCLPKLSRSHQHKKGRHQTPSHRTAFKTNTTDLSRKSTLPPVPRPPPSVIARPLQENTTRSPYKRLHTPSEPAAHPLGSCKAQPRPVHCQTRLPSTLKLQHHVATDVPLQLHQPLHPTFAPSSTQPCPPSSFCLGFQLPVTPAGNPLSPPACRSRPSQYQYQFFRPPPTHPQHTPNLHFVASRPPEQRLPAREASHALPMALYSLAELHLLSLLGVFLWGMSAPEQVDALRQIKKKIHQAFPAATEESFCEIRRQLLFLDEVAQCPTTHFRFDFSDRGFLTADICNPTSRFCPWQRDACLLHRTSNPPPPTYRTPRYDSEVKSFWLPKGGIIGP